MAGGALAGARAGAKRGKGVAYCPHCDGPLFKRKRVAVVGRGNSGVEAAIDRAGIVAHVTLIEFDGASSRPRRPRCTAPPGVFAAGDATTVLYKQIIIAMGEGAKAA